MLTLKQTKSRALTLDTWNVGTLFNRDDSPLYLFESNIEEHPDAKAMVNEYEIPRYLREDLFVELVSNHSLHASPINRVISSFAVAWREASTAPPMVPDRTQALWQRGAPGSAWHICMEHEYLWSQAMGHDATRRGHHEESGQR